MGKIIKVHKWKSLSKEVKLTILQRSQIDIINQERKVLPIIQAVQKEGDQALVRMNKKYDKIDIPISKLRVSEAEFEHAETLLSHEVKNAIRTAYKNVKRYHSSEIISAAVQFHEISPGVFIGNNSIPIDSVGIYVPRGKGCFPSMVYMLAVPAAIAKVPRRVMVTPPLADGSIDPACLFAARLCEIHEVYKVGGAHAIAALTFGTKTIAPVLKIVGPGSSFVNAAKRHVHNYVDIGIPAGPSESIIIADGSTPAELVAYDLCIEAEHGKDSMALVLTHKKEYATQIVKHLHQIIQEAPKAQQEILNATFAKYKGIILTESEENSIEITNKISPEHLMIHSEVPKSIASHITNAGEILLGKNSPFSLANYAAGANAVIPTGGLAKTYSAVSVSDFMKQNAVIKITQKGFEDLSPIVQTLANYEGFHFHEKALAIRRNLKEKQKEGKNKE